LRIISVIQHRLENPASCPRLRKCICNASDANAVLAAAGLAVGLSRCEEGGMSILGSNGWSLFGQWYGRVCIVWPIILALIGLLIALVGAALSYTGVGLALAWVLFWIDIVIMIVMIALAGGGILFASGLFFTDMLDNFISNWWRRRRPPTGRIR
jgi:hypothetical protein